MHPLVAQQIQRPQHGQNGALTENGPEQRAEEELVAAVGGQAGVQIQRRVSLGQVLHPARQQIIFPGHPGNCQRGFLHHTGIEIREFPGVIRLENVLHPGDRLTQQIPVLCGGYSVQPGKKVFINPLAQGLCRLGSLVEERPVIGGERGDQQPVKGQTQGQKGPQGGQAEELPPLIDRQIHVCSSR